MSVAVPLQEDGKLFIRRTEVKRESVFLAVPHDVPHAENQRVASSGPTAAWRVRNSSAIAP